MLAFWGFLTIAGLILAIASKRVSPLSALLLVPVCTSLAAGFGLKTGSFIVSGLTTIAPVVAMFVFAILFFGVLTDAGLMEPVIRWVLRAVGNRPAYIVPGTALLALLLHLDGSGAVVFLVAIPTLLPLYIDVGMDRRILACSTSMAAGVNFLPWTGPTLRAAAALHTTPLALFRPLLPVQLVGLVYVFVVSYLLGRREEKRLGRQKWAVANSASTTKAESPLVRRTGWRMVINVLLVFAVLGTIISGVAEPAVLFMIGTALALLVNFPAMKEQTMALERHARAALTMTAILCSAGALSGILKGTGMLTAMARACTAHMPAGGAHHLPFVLGLLAMPLSLMFDPDSYYFGVLPVLASMVQGFGIPAASVAEASLLGQMTTGFPVSPLTPATFLVTGLSEIELSDHQRFTGPFLLGASIVMTVTAAMIGVFPF